MGNFPTKIGLIYIPETEVTSFWAMNGIIWWFPSSFPFACFFEIIILKRWLSIIYMYKKNQVSGSNLAGAWRWIFEGVVWDIFWVYPPVRMPVITRIIAFLVGNRCKRSFVTVILSGGPLIQTRWWYFLCSSRNLGNDRIGNFAIPSWQDWNPHVDFQAIDRAHRIGQTRKVWRSRGVSGEVFLEGVNC